MSACPKVLADTYEHDGDDGYIRPKDQSHDQQLVNRFVVQSGHADELSYPTHDGA